MNASTSATALPALLGDRPKKRSRRRPLLAAATLAVAGVAAWQITARATAADPAPAYTTAPVAKTDVVKKVTATGTLSPVVTVQVGSQISGRIAELRADYNTQVKAGDVIAIIEPDQLESALSQAKARLTTAHADHRRARAQAEAAAATYTRAKALGAAGAVSKAEVESALASKKSADASVQSASSAITVARAAVSQAETNLEYTVIKSPIDGVVVSRSVDVGQTVAASLSAPILFVIAEDLRKMEVHTSVAESDIGQLEDGMDVEFSVDAFPTDTFQGTVKQVRYEATNVSGVVTYDAVVAVQNDELKLRPGMTANVSFIAAAARDTLAVPTKALLYRPADFQRPERPERPDGARRGPRAANGERPDGARRGGRGNRRMLFVLRDGVATPVRVEVGLSDGALTAITSDELDEGDAIITGDGSGGSATAAPASDANQRGNRRGGRGRFRNRSVL
jgi:HlyD family secretion protein